MNQEIPDSENLTVGDILKNSRESQGYTIAEIVRFTKIRYSHIKSIENNDFNALPERTYTLGYIDKYCRFLGIEPKPILKLVDETYQLRNPIYSNMVQNNRLDKKYNPINLIKESIIDFIFIIFSFGLKRYNTDQDMYFNKNYTPKKKVPFIFWGIVLVIIIIIGSICCIKKVSKISIEELPISINEDLSKELDLIKVKKDLNNNAQVNGILNQEDMVVVKNPHNKTLLNQDGTTLSESLDNKSVNTVKEKTNQPRLTPWPKTNQLSNIVLLFNKRVWVKIYNKYNKNIVYLERYFNEGDYFKVPNVPELYMDVGNYKGLYLLVNNEAIYLSSNSSSLVLRRIDLVDSILLSKYNSKDI